MKNNINEAKQNTFFNALLVERILTISKMTLEDINKNPDAL